MKFFASLLRPGDVFKPDHEVWRFLFVMTCFGIGFGCFGGVMTNYLVEEVKMQDTAMRGVLEFFRELPGLFLIVILALLAKRDEWWIVRLGLSISMIGMVGLFFAPPQMAVATALIVMWSLGEHILMPVRSSITMHSAKPGQEGGALGVVAGLGSLGTIAGSMMVVGIFYVIKRFGFAGRTGFNTVFALVFVLLVIGLLISLTVKKGHAEHVKRPHLYFRKKYNKFYILEIFYGARKQVFFTFAPFMLVKFYGMDTEHLALLAGLCAGVNIFCGPIAGWIIDKIGYRKVMIWDTVFLMAVCIFYGYADKMFGREIAFWVVCVNFVLDAIITNASMATNVYVREISDSREELTSTLSTGISVNHLISILVALVGGWVGLKYGYGILFSISAFMALMNTLFALTIPKTGKAA